MASGDAEKEVPVPEKDHVEDGKGGAEQERDILQRVAFLVDNGLRSGFGRLTDVITAHPRKVIAITLVLTAIGASGFSVYTEENEGSKLWTPQDTKALEDKAWVEQRFGYGTRQIFLFAEADGQANVLTKERLLNFLYFWKRVEGQEAYLDGETLTYAKLCVKDGGRCRAPRSVLGLWNYDESALQADPDVLATVNTRELPRGGPPLLHYLGSVHRDESGRITGCEAVRLELELENNLVYSEEHGLADVRADEWEKTVGETYNGIRRGDLWVYMWTIGYVDHVAQETLLGDVAVLPIGYLLTIIFVCIVMWRKRRRRSHIALGLMSIVGVGLSTLTAIGFALYFGVKYNPVVNVLVLVLLGIGVDDTFVIYDAWLVRERDEAGEKHDVRTRIRKAMMDAGPSITTTSVTDMVAFAAGTATVLPALRDFCIYACLGIFFDFLYQCTFVVAVLYFEARREEGDCCGGPGDPRADVCCCFKADDEAGCCGTTVKGKPEDDRRWMQTVLGHWLPKGLFKPGGVIAAVVVALALLAIGIVGLLQLEMNFDYEWFIPDDHELQGAFRVRDRHFGSGNLLAWLYTGQAEYHLEPVQRELVACFEALRANRWVVGASLVSWYEDYRAARGIAPDAVIPSAGFYSGLRAFLNTPQGARHNSSIVWSGNGYILATQNAVQFEADFLDTGSNGVDAMKSVRAAIEPWANDWIGARVYNFIFDFYEGLAVIQWETLRNVITAAGCVFGICLLLLANLPAAFAVLICIALIDIDLLGFTYWAGYHYNSVTCINAVLAIGLSVDYTAHVVRSFLSHAGRRRDRATFALREIGSAVVNGGVSTFVAVLPLAMAKSYIFQVFFTMFALIILFGLFHGVIVAPAVLRWIGPQAYPGSPQCASTYDDVTEMRPKNDQVTEVAGANRPPERAWDGGDVPRAQSP